MARELLRGMPAMVLDAQQAVPIIAFDSVVNSKGHIFVFSRGLVLRP